MSVPPQFLAHSNTSGNAHGLEEHLLAVAALSRQHAAPFGGSAWAELAGRWHDLGKYRVGFQKYIRQNRDADAHIEGKVGGREKTHSAAGALWAIMRGHKICQHSSQRTSFKK